MATSDDNAVHPIVIQYCFDRGLSPVQTKREMETTEQYNMCLRHCYPFKACWSGEPVEESRGRPTKRDDKNQFMDVIYEHCRLTVCEVGDMLETILPNLSMTKVCV